MLLTAGGVRFHNVVREVFKLDRFGAVCCNGKESFVASLPCDAQHRVRLVWSVDPHFCADASIVHKLTTVCPAAILKRQSIANRQQSVMGEHITCTDRVHKLEDGTYQNDVAFDLWHAFAVGSNDIELNVEEGFACAVSFDFAAHILLFQHEKHVHWFGYSE